MHRYLLISLTTLFVSFGIAHATTNLKQSFDFSPSLVEKAGFVYRWLLDIGVREPEEVIEKFPEILNLDVEAHLKPQYLWLQRAQVKDLAELITLDPKTWLTLNQKHLPANDLALSLPLLRRLIAKVALKEIKIQSPVHAPNAPPSPLSGMNYIGDYADNREDMLIHQWGFRASDIANNTYLQQASLSAAFRMILALEYLGLNPAQDLSFDNRIKAVSSIEPSDIFLNLKRMQIVPPHATHLWHIPKARLMPSRWFINNPSLWLHKANRCPL